MNINFSPTHSPLILLVDDDRTTRMMLRRAMIKEGYRVAEASNGLEGVEAYRQVKPDMVLLDARMPSLDGFACCQQIQAVSEFKSTPILMITSLEDEDSVDRAFEVGATDYITKPIHWAVLRRRVQRLLQEKQAEREILKALERERELNALRSGIVTMISHEYQTPLTAIISSAELLECYWPRWDEEKRKKHLQRIQTAAGHLSQLVRDVLSIDLAESGQLEFNPLALDLEQWCRSLVAEAGDRSREVALHFEGDGQNLILDGKLLQQILTNLLSNAIKYSPDGGEIELTVSCRDLDREDAHFGSDGQEKNRYQISGGGAPLEPADDTSSAIVCLQVRDRGIGVLATERRAIFQAFHRGSNVSTIQGTGLGLAIVKRCVELHGGQIEIDSELDVGTTVTVTLPARRLCQNASLDDRRSISGSSSLEATG
ncbi:response regulator [Oxynema sp. CENA135]|uniref:hybrid sensor histidine kinase/response regulator n=1 Tax=Oxynema sp. CENA135 TaxID=984206 RepID=UPI00190C6010|nr:hybrid sensor histidine kinase/response regulator [Oxynema sp. CENA135]MBK4729105.1 response regulator [Oxynema sp. CENA135]